MAFETAALPADGGALTVDQSVAAQLAEMEKEQPVEQAEQADAPAEDTEAAPDAVEGASEAEEPGTGEEEATETEGQEAPIEPPQFWSAEAKARFRDVPRDVQEIILQQEQSRNAFTSKAAQEASEKGKAAEAERTRLVQFNEQLGKLVPQAEQTFANKWSGIDWVQLTEQLGAEAATKLKFQHDAEQAQLASLQEAQAQTQKAAFDEYVKAEAAKLPSLCPDLVDPKEGPARRQALGKYLIDNGVSPQALSGASATELTIAWKAQQWDLAQAKAKSLATKQPAKPAVAKPAPSRPGAAVASLSQQSAALAEAEKAFARNPSIQNAERLQLAQMSARRK